MKILVINGVNLNMLGIREPEKYGTKSYAELKKYIRTSAKALGLKCKTVQSNYEGEYRDKRRAFIRGYSVRRGSFNRRLLARDFQKA